MKVRFQLKETVVTITADEKFIETAKDVIVLHRSKLEQFIRREPFFRTTLEPYPPVKEPEVVRRMVVASAKVGVGPMAAVAGTLAELAVEAMVNAGAGYAIVDNGGDIAIVNDKPVTIGIYAGSSKIKDIALQFEPRTSPWGICTSSGTLGHSISFGNADAAVVIAESASLADAAATALGNEVKDASCIERAFNAISSVKGIEGALVVCGDKMGAWGKIPKIVRAEVSKDLITRDPIVDKVYGLK